MAVTVSDLKTLFKASDANTAELQHALDVATGLVGLALAEPWRPVPDAVRDECVRRTAWNVYNKIGGTGTGQMLSSEGTPTPVSNDPLRSSQDLIKRFINRV